MDENQVWQGAVCQAMMIFNVYFPVGLALSLFQEVYLACSMEDSITLCRRECLISKIATAKLVIKTTAIYWAPTRWPLSNLILTVAARPLLCILFYPIRNGYFDKIDKILEATWRVRSRAEWNLSSPMLTFILLLPKVITLHHTKNGSDYSGLNLSTYLLHLIILHRGFFPT